MVKMLFHFLAAIVIGIIAGTITGLIPGIHINLVSIGVVSISSALLGFASPAVIGAFIVSMAITHTFLDTIPSIYLGAPDDDTALAVLPGHQLLLMGMGHEAVRLTVVGSLLCLLLSVLLFPLFLTVFPLIYTAIRHYLGWVLLCIVVFMILKEKNPNKIFWSLAIFLFSGILGMIVLNMGMNQPLFPMLSGLFGISMLVYSLFKGTEIPKQAVTEMIKVKKTETAKAVAAGVFSGSLTALLPGVGASHAAIIAGTLFKSITNFTYLILIGGVNTVNFLLSIATLYTLGKARNGAVIAITQITDSININNIIIFIASSLIAGGIAAILALSISKVFCHFVGRLRYKALCIAVIALISLLVFVFSGFLGLFVLLVSASIGLVPVITGVGRNNLMGCLLLPVILYFLI